MSKLVDKKKEPEVELETDKPTSSLRYDEGKLRVDLVPAEIIIELARVYTAGAKKYKDNNWRDPGMKWTRCIASLERHMLKWKMGLEIDPETQCHHLAQVAWNALTLMMYQMQGLGTDDRWRPERFTIDEDFNLIPVKKSDK